MLAAPRLFRCAGRRIIWRESAEAVFVTTEEIHRKLAAVAETGRLAEQTAGVLRKVLP